MTRYVDWKLIYEFKKRIVGIQILKFSSNLKNKCEIKQCVLTYLLIFQVPSQTGFETPVEWQLISEHYVMNNRS